VGDQAVEGAAASDGASWARWLPVLGAPAAQAHQMSVHGFVDETKASGLLMATAVLAPRQLAPTRTLLRRLLLPRQERLHFTKPGSTVRP
jgi:hypothetical protein